MFRKGWLEMLTDLRRSDPEGVDSFLTETVSNFSFEKWKDYFFIVKPDRLRKAPVRGSYPVDVSSFLPIPTAKWPLKAHPCLERLAYFLSRFCICPIPTAQTVVPEFFSCDICEILEGQKVYDLANTGVPSITEFVSEVKDPRIFAEMLIRLFYTHLMKNEDAWADRDRFDKLKSALNENIVISALLSKEITITAEDKSENQS